MEDFDQPILLHFIAQLEQLKQELYRFMDAHWSRVCTAAKTGNTEKLAELIQEYGMLVSAANGIGNALQYLKDLQEMGKNNDQQ